MCNHISFVLRKNTVNDNKFSSLNTLHKHNLFIIKCIIIKFKYIFLNFANLFL